MKPEVLSSETVFRGRIFDVSVARIREGGVEYDREIVSHGGSVVVLPFFEDGTIAFVRQYRHAAGEYLLELPAGTIEPGEAPESAARRELLEEIGVRAAVIEKLTEFYVSPGFLSEIMHVYTARGLTAEGQRLEDDEILTIERIPVGEAVATAVAGGFRDAKTIAGVLVFAAGLANTETVSGPDPAAAV